MDSSKKMYQQYSKGDKPEFIYFNGRGRGEGVRCLFAAGDIPYIDNRLELGSQQWKDMKPTTPYGRLPILKIGEETIAESVAIGSYVAKQAGLAGDTPIDEAKILSVAFQCNEFREELARVMYLQVGEEEKAKEMQKFLTELASNIMDNLTKFLGDHQFFVKNKLSFADIWFYHCLELLILGAGKNDFLGKWSTLDNLYKRVEKVPRIAHYLKTRAKTAF